MEEQAQGKRFCKKLVYGDKIDPRVIFGIILKEEDGFIFFKTGHREYTVSKSVIISIEDTKMEFRGDP